MNRLSVNLRLIPWLASIRQTASTGDRGVSWLKPSFSIVFGLGLSLCICLSGIPSLVSAQSVPVDAILPTPPDSTAAPAAGQFAVSDDGAATYSYPIWVPDGRRNLKPSLSLVYNSQVENGMLGVGWRLSGLSSITRCKRDIARDGYNAAIQFDSDDRFCLDGQRLVTFPSVADGIPRPYGTEGTEYRTEQEQFAQIINGPIDERGPVSFEVRLKNGLILFYGTSPDSRLEGKRMRVTPVSLYGTDVQRDFTQEVRLTWALSEIRDRFGNNMTVEYSTTGDASNDQGYEQLPVSIHYTGTVDKSLPARREVRFLYEPRPDTHSFFINGFKLERSHRLARIVLAAPNPVDTAPVKEYVLQYEESTASKRSILQGIAECDPQQVCLNPTTFSYSSVVRDGFTDVDTGIHDDSAGHTTTPSFGDKFDRIVTGDIDGNGCDDLIYSARDAPPWVFSMKAAYRLSSCYDAIGDGEPPLPTPSPDTLLQLTPPIPSAPNSVPSTVFNPQHLPGWNYKYSLCESNAFHLIECDNQLIGADLDLDGRIDLLSNSVEENCGHPLLEGCFWATTYNLHYATSIFLASSMDPSKWNPSSLLYGGETHYEFDITRKEALLSSYTPPILAYVSIYVGDINGDGYPDLVRLYPEGWSYRLNHGHASKLLPSQHKCGAFDRPCLDLGAPSPIASDTVPSTGLGNVFMTDVFREGTTSLILRDTTAGSSSRKTNWYVALRLDCNHLPSNTDVCPVQPPVNLALVAGDAHDPARRDWFFDVNGDGLPDSVSIPLSGGHPYIAINSGNGFDAPVQVTKGVPAVFDKDKVRGDGLVDRTKNVAILDYDGNGTQDAVYSTPSADPKALIWLPVDLKSGGRPKIVQVRDNRGKLAMTVWSQNGGGSYSQLWSSDDMGQGSGALRWLPVQMDGDGKTQIVQLWDNHGKRAMIVWGPNADGSYSQRWGSNDMGQGPGKDQWLPVQMHGDGKTQIVQVTSNNDKLVAMTVWGPDANTGGYSQISGSTDLAQIPDGFFMPVQRKGDAGIELVQIREDYSSHGKMTISVWIPNGNQGYSRVWGPEAVDQARDTHRWIPVQMYGDGTTQLLQIWDNKGKLAMTVWSPKMDHGYAQVWSSDDMGRDSRALDWLPVDIGRNGKTQLVQIWSKDNKLRMTMWVPQANGSYSSKFLDFNTMDMGQRSDVWLTMGGRLQPQILRMWNNEGKLAMRVWEANTAGSFAQAWSSNDMGGYLHVMLTNDKIDQYRWLPLFDQQGNPIPSGSMLQTFDVNGDGLTDLVQIVDGVVHVYIRKGLKRDLLTTITDRGASISVAYAPLTHGSMYSTSGWVGVNDSSEPPYPGRSYLMNKGPWVVESYSIPRAGSLGSDLRNQYSYTYKGALQDLTGRGWLGFGQVTRLDHQTQEQTIYRYYNGVKVGSAYPFAHRLQSLEKRVKLSDTGRTSVREETTTYVPTGTKDGRYLVVLPKRHERQEFEGLSKTSMARIRSLDTRFEYDSFGNVTKRATTTEDGYTEESVVSFQQDLSAWLISMQTGSAVTSGVPGGALEKRTRTYIPDPKTGVTLEEIVEPDGDNDTYLHTTYHYDVHGVPTGSTFSDKTGSDTRCVAVQYDAESIYPAVRMNQLGHTTRVAIHPALGIPTLFEDANGVRETRQYDTFGRLRTVRPANGANVSLAYTSIGFPFMEATDAKGQVIRISYDAFQNVIEKNWKAFDGQTVVLLNAYNGQNLLAKKEGPCYLGPLPCAEAGSEQYAYDELGRLIKVNHADGSARKVTYTDLKTTYVDESGNQRSVLEDQRGRLVKSLSVTAEGKEVPIRYRYAPFGLVASITDPANNTVDTQYDIRGRVRTLHDPDRGLQAFQWSPFDELRESRDSNNRVTTYQHDPLGRVIKLTNPDGITQFRWDTAAHGIGLLDRSKSPDGIESVYTYDALARTNTVASKIDGALYELKMSYDGLGRLSTVAYPEVRNHPRFAIRNQFNAFGYLEQVVDEQSQLVYWKVDGENERGQIIQEAFGNGLTTSRRFDARGFLRKISTSAAENTIQELIYDYEPTGSLQSRTTRFPDASLIETFGYDPLDRLTKWSASSSTSDASQPPKQLLEHIFKYDDLGNLRLRSMSSPGGPGQNLTYQYGEHGAGPHAVTHVNDDAYGYDPGGNQITGPGRTVRYTSFDLPAHIITGSKQFELRYDASHVRSVMGDSTGTRTAYVGGLYEKRVHNGQAIHVFYVPGLSNIIAQVERDETSGKQSILYLHHDRLASVQATTDQAGNIAGRANYEPFGGVVDAADPSKPLPNGLGGVTLGFTEHSADTDLNLINMKGRIYDPKIGRFLTNIKPCTGQRRADPVPARRHCSMRPEFHTRNRHQS